MASWSRVAGFEPGMKQKSTVAPIKNEADNKLKNDNYTVAMARTSDPHSASAQFFIQRRRQQLPQPYRADDTGLGFIASSAR
jgi:cyclophilin family peptidyl-prolyl cis-trans isomerase